eukprot:TRINITY_DN27066_c0_g1_i1.p1 TRINITY_DN27066_c0_g1~~TRINITY_DN27066_c0_g1_i1.p1  ORF type:complete len:1095 (-),score=162.14 TRINITY_DN27066_c0_g1_i1:12-3296(-)
MEVPMRAGTGQLYKCAICDELVYESHLDYHVLVCPDPKHGQTSGSPKATEVATSATPTAPSMPEPTNPAVTASLALSAVTVRSGGAIASMNAGGDFGCIGTATTDAPVERRAVTEVKEEARVTTTLPEGLPQVSVVSLAGNEAPFHDSDSSQITKNRIVASSSAIVNVGSGEAIRVAEAHSTPASPPTDRRKSGVEKHNHANTDKARNRRSSYPEDVRRKGEEYNTFQPKTLPRGSPRVVSRHAEVTGHGPVNLRCELRARTQKLKLAEAQMYADVTHKPKISTFAQAWNQRQMDACVDNQPQTVFERLYSSAVRSRICKEVLEASAEGDADHIKKGLGDKGSNDRASGACAMASSQAVQPSMRQHTARGIATCEQLYSDAVNRRERLRILSQHLGERQDESGREKSCVDKPREKVLSISRRYFWRMLERQVKTSFDATVGDDPTLSYSALEDFLVHFGCLPRRSSRESSGGDMPGLATKSDRQSAAEKEARNLRDAVWRHLDPHKTGHVDLLTLTIFFHVLMGAVDDPTKVSVGTCSVMGASAGGVVDTVEEAPSPTSPLPSASILGGSDSSLRGATGDPTAPSAVKGLAAISEEDGPPHPTATSDVGSVSCSTAATSSMNASGGESADDEGHQIVELLVRFDPVRLRAEFKTLYLNRLHLQSVQVPIGAERLQGEVVAPEIDPRSRNLAQRVVERQREEIGDESISHADVMLWRHKQTQAKLEEKRMLAMDEEVNGCTFRPQVFATTRCFQLQNTNPSAPRGQALYDRAIVSRERKNIKTKTVTQARELAEQTACTFKPDTTKSGKSFVRAHEGTTAVPRGFYESWQRVRAAGEVNRQLRLQKEDRLARAQIVDCTLVERPQHQVPDTGPNRRDHVFSNVGRFLAASGDANREEGFSSLSPVVESPRRNRCSAMERGRRLSGARVGRASTASPRRLDSAQGQHLSASPVPVNGQLRQGTTNRRCRSTSVERPLLPFSQRCGSAGDSTNARVEGISGAAEVAFVAGAPRGIVDGACAEAAATCLSEETPVLCVDVNITPGKTPERIVLREGQSVAEVAAEFAVAHALSPVLAERLHNLLTEVLHRQEEQALQQ